MEEKTVPVPVHPHFPVGSLVLLKVTHWGPGTKRGKGEFPYHGPYVVYNSSPTGLILRDTDGRYFRAPVQRVKPYKVGSFNFFTPDIDDLEEALRESRGDVPSESQRLKKFWKRKSLLEKKSPRNLRNSRQRRKTLSREWFVEQDPLYLSRR